MPSCVDANCDREGCAFSWGATCVEVHQGVSHREAYPSEGGKNIMVGSMRTAYIFAIETVFAAVLCGLYALGLYALGL